MKNSENWGRNCHGVIYPSQCQHVRRSKKKIKTATNISAQKLKVGTESAKPSIRQRLQMMQSTKGSSSGTGDGQTWACFSTREALWDSRSQLGFCKLKYKTVNRRTMFCSDLQKEGGESQWLMKFVFMVTSKASLLASKEWKTERTQHLINLCFLLPLRK